MNLKNLFKSFTVLVAFLALMTGAVYAQSCETNYGGGENCSYDIEIEVEKKVRIKGDNQWKDKVTDVDSDDVVEFRITVRNTGDVALDDVNVEDILPDEMKRIAGDGLTNTIVDLKVDEKVTFIIETEVKDSEYDRDENFEKCVVNKVEVEQDGDNKGSDTATVCYGDTEITELPETGPMDTVALTVMGLLSTGLGLAFKRK